MKILLLNPPTYDNKAFIREGRCTHEQGAWATQWPPITLATAAAMLEEKGHDVAILDCPAQIISVDDLLERTSRGTFDVIAWATGTTSIQSDLALAPAFKKISSDVCTAVFGTHVTTLAEKTLRESDGLDCVMRNEPEETLVALVECLRNNNTIESVKGISFRDQAGNVVHNSPRGYMPDLDSLPFPAWHLVDLNRYRLPLIGEKYVILLPVRGCPYACSFCTTGTYYGKKLRRRSVSRMMDEIETIVSRFGISNFFIWADTFTADRDYVMRFCEEIGRRNIDMKWTCNSRVDTVDQELLKAMSRAGCWMISYGIESGSQKVLDEMKKGITLNQSEMAVKMAKRAGILVAGHFVLGFPEGNEDTIKETIKFAMKLNPNVAQFYCAVPFPGSSLYDEASDKGWITGKGFEEFSQNNAVMDLPGLSPSVVNRYRKRGYLKFYLSLRRVAGMWKLMRMGGIRHIARSGVGFIKWIYS